MSILISITHADDDADKATVGFVVASAQPPRPRTPPCS